MRKLVSGVVAVAALILLWRALFSDAVDGMAAANLVRNGGFESGGTPPDQWNLEDEASRKGSVSLVDSPSHSGKALKLSPNRRNGGDRPLAVGQAIPVKQYAGRRIALSGYLGAEGGTTAVLAGFLLKSGGGTAGETILKGSAKGSELEFHDGSLAVPLTGVETLILVCGTEGTSGAAYFDEIVVGPEGSAPRAAARTEAPGGDGLPASVAIEAGNVIREIPRTLYGTNVEWIFDGNLLWDRDKQDLHSQIVQLTSNLNLSLIRFPGGGFSDFYHWRDGVGPRGSRKVTEHEPGGGVRSSHNFGTDEALEFAQRAGAELMITVNVSTGGPEEAAEWVAYVNGQRRLVTYWEIGNEVYMSGGNPGTPGKAMPAREYANRVLAFARAMRKRDPGIRIGAVGGDSYGSFSFLDDPNWNREVLRIAGGEIDFFSVHNAYAPILFDKKSRQDLRAIYSAMLAAPVHIRQSLQRVADQIRQHVPQKSGHIKIAVTEWGPLFHPEPDSPLVDHVKTLGSALFVASAFNALLHSPQTEIANFFKLNDITFMGWIGSADDAEAGRPAGERRYRPTAPYLAFKLFSKHFGSRLVRSEVASATYRSVNAGLVESVAEVPYLDVASSLSANGKTLFVIAINKHFDRPIQARISVAGFEPSGQATVRTLDGSGIDAHTGTKLPRGVNWAKQMEDKVNPRFHKSGPDDVRLTEITRQGIGDSFEMRLPPASITAVEMPAKR